MKTKKSDLEQLLQLVCDEVNVKAVFLSNQIGYITKDSPLKRHKKFKGKLITYSYGKH